MSTRTDNYGKVFSAGQLPCFVLSTKGNEPFVILLEGDGIPWRVKPIIKGMEAGKGINM
jgi:hypothetical protein